MSFNNLKYTIGDRDMILVEDPNQERLFDRMPEIETRYLPAIKYEVNQSNGAPEIPNEV